MRFCPFCNSQMSVTSQFCTSCGKKNSSPPVAQSGGNRKLLASTAVLLLVIVGGLLYTRRNQAMLSKASIGNPTSVKPVQEQSQTSAQPITQPTSSIPQAIPAQSQTIYDGRIGTTWNFYCTSSALRCSRTHIGTKGKIDFDVAVFEGETVTDFQPFLSGVTLRCIFQTANGLFLSESFDGGGKMWEPRFLIAPGVKLSGATISDERDSSQVIRIVGESTQADPQAGIGAGDTVHIVLQRYQGPGQWKVMEKRKG